MVKKTTKRKKKNYKGPERRDFIRLSYKTPLMYKVCKRKTFSKLMQGYTHNISRSGLRCTLSDKVPMNSVVWLQLDIGALSMCEEIERGCAILQHGILGKVVWVKKKKDKSCDVGVRFITREEKKIEDWLIKKPIV